MFVNKIKKTDLDNVVVKDLMDAKWAFYGHSEDKDVYMLSPDYKYLKNGEPCEDMKFDRLEVFMKKFVKKHKGSNGFMVFFRDGDEGFEILEMAIIKDMLFNYLSHSQLVEIFAKSKIKVKCTLIMTLREFLSSNRESNGEVVGVPTNGYYDINLRKVWVRL